MTEEKTMYIVNMLDHPSRTIKLTSLREVKEFMTSDLPERKLNWLITHNGYPVADCCMNWSTDGRSVRVQSVARKYRIALRKASSKLAAPIGFERVKFKTPLANRRQAEVLFSDMD